MVNKKIFKYNILHNGDWIHYIIKEYPIKNENDKKVKKLCLAVNKQFACKLVKNKNTQLYEIKYIIPDDKIIDDLIDQYLCGGGPR